MNDSAPKIHITTAAQVIRRAPDHHAGLKKAIAEVVNLWASPVERTLQVEIK